MRQMRWERRLQASVNVSGGRASSKAGRIARCFRKDDLRLGKIVIDLGYNLVQEYGHKCQVSGVRPVYSIPGALAD